MTLSISRKLEFDAGHRIPNHHSQCRNIHGHRYTLHVEVVGKLITREGSSSEGMVIDFGHLKAAMNEHVVKRWDHAFLLWEGDHPMRHAISHLVSVQNFTHKTVLLPCIPTVENLVEQAWQLLEKPLSEYGLTLAHIRLYETPNCWADKYADA